MLHGGWAAAAPTPAPGDLASCIAVARPQEGKSTVQTVFRDLWPEMTPESVGLDIGPLELGIGAGGVCYDDNELTLHLSEY